MGFGFFALQGDAELEVGGDAVGFGGHQSGQTSSTASTTRSSAILGWVFAVTRTSVNLVKI